MTIELAEWRDILQVLHETYSIWSPGLDRTQYQLYISSQLNHPWSRRNFRYLIYRCAKKIVASLKLYTMEFASRGHVYKLGGLGAVFTQQKERGLGYASRLIAKTKELCYQQGYDGLYLFSDIETEFYGRLGFQEYGGYEFFIYPPGSSEHRKEECSFNMVGGLDCQGFGIGPLDISILPFLSRHYQRWLRRQDYGVVRSELYWSYKLFRESYLHSYSKWNWPRLELVALSSHAIESGYAIFEQADTSIRVLEVVGLEEIQRKLWMALIDLATERGVWRIRGWEGVCPEFFPCHVFNERRWGIPMMLPLRKEIEAWQDFIPCPLLELDHL